MAEQSFLAKAGLRLGTLGSLASLAFAAPLATGNYDPSCHTDAARTGGYFSRAVGSELFQFVVGGQAGPGIQTLGTATATTFAGTNSSATLGGGTGTVSITFNGAVTDRGFSYDTALSLRWKAITTATAETGVSNAGSAFNIQAYDDTGAVVDNTFVVSRTAGAFFGWVRNAFIPLSAVWSSNNATSKTLTWSTGTSGTGSQRWVAGSTSVSESGGNAGSGFFLQARNDSSVQIDIPLQWNRAALSTVVFQTRFVNVTAGTLTTGQTLMDFSATWSNAVGFTGFFYNITDTNSSAASLLYDFQIGGVSRFNSNKNGAVVFSSVDDLTASQITFGRTFTLTGALGDVFQITYTAALAGAFTITRYNWFELDNPTGAATVTNATALAFDAAPGTHKCIDSGTTKTTPTGVDAWIKHNVNGTIYFSNAYLSKTA